MGWMPSEAPAAPARRAGGRRWLRLVLWLALGWFLLNLGVVLLRWGQVVLAPVPATPARIELDKRTDTSTPGHVIVIAGTRPTPSKGDLFGHMWVAWPITPPGAPSGTREAGYYARSHLEAAGAMVVALLAPWGPFVGQVPVPGTLKADDGWWRHYEIAVRTDDAGLARALAVDRRWRGEQRYTLRPGLFGIGTPATIACQDYAMQVASALGLEAPEPRDWTLFPLASLRELARANALEDWMDGAVSPQGPAR
jgi:hypothetical protein